VTSLEVVDNDSKLQQLYYGLLNAYIGPKTAKLLFSCKWIKLMYCKWCIVHMGWHGYQL